ncbi:hypothetical protein ASF41_23055 [Methylobacterium sp. Leaf111]|uniref:hypothetical protein n=1 Tax=Methylobacterium sp. Leaf111 TaxID=1736257 RepID=UPI0006F2993A|nr:hypothetical protein [Methylobacterium sp. Leaf111]KQP58136.1 hypothetical protein ASF41_23055 [Methylobacterium sp. Leaf111]
MTDKLKRTILGAVIAIALAIAVSYGLITQQTADGLQNKANQAIAEDQGAQPQTSQQQAPSNPTSQAPRAPASQPNDSATPAPSPAPRQ